MIGMLAEMAGGQEMIVWIVVAVMGMIVCASLFSAIVAMKKAKLEHELKMKALSNGVSLSKDGIVVDGQKTSES